MSAVIVRGSSLGDAAAFGTGKKIARQPCDESQTKWWQRVGCPGVVDVKLIKMLVTERAQQSEGGGDNANQQCAAPESNAQTQFAREKIMSFCAFKMVPVHRAAILTWLWHGL